MKTVDSKEVDPLLPLVLGVIALTAGNIETANAPDVDEEPTGETVSIIPMDAALELAKDLTNHEYDLALDVVAMVGNPVKAAKGVVGVVEDVFKKGDGDIIGNAELDSSKLLPAPKQSTPELEGAPIESDIIPAGTKFKQAVSPGQKSPGAFATEDNIIDEKYVRNDLSVTPGFKEEISGVREVEVVRDVRGQKSTVGPQEHNGVVHDGGGSQVQFLEYDPENPYVKFSSDEIPFKKWRF